MTTEERAGLDEETLPSKREGGQEKVELLSAPLYGGRMDLMSYSLGLLGHLHFYVSSSPLNIGKSLSLSHPLSFSFLPPRSQVVQGCLEDYGR